MPPTKRPIAFGLAGAADDHQLLMVRADKTNPHIEEHLPAGSVDDVAEMAILLCAEAGEVAMRSPQQTSDADATLHCRREGAADSRPGGIVEALVMITAPVGEVELIPLPQALHHLQQSPEVGGAMSQDLDLVPRGRGQAVRPRRSSIPVDGLPRSSGERSQPSGPVLQLPWRTLEHRGKQPWALGLSVECFGRVLWSLFRGGRHRPTPPNTG